MENRFLVDSEFLSPQALARKHQLETDPSSRKSHMEYLPGMEQLHSDVRDKVIGQMESYDPARYTARDVRAALDHETCSVEDFKALLSPAAEPFLEEMAARARLETSRHFGNTVYMFTPLYIANYCENYCVYCGFNCYNHIQRMKLDMAQIEHEMQVIADSGMEEILILTGESRAQSDVEYIGEACKLARKYFRMVGLEIYPVNTDEYRYLHECGADYVTVFQETYDRDKYETLHLMGHKRVWPYRFDAQERALDWFLTNLRPGSVITARITSLAPFGAFADVEFFDLPSGFDGLHHGADAENQVVIHSVMSFRFQGPLHEPFDFASGGFGQMTVERFGACDLDRADAHASRREHFAHAAHGAPALAEEQIEGPWRGAGGDDDGLPPFETRLRNSARGFAHEARYEPFEEQFQPRGHPAPVGRCPDDEQVGAADRFAQLVRRIVRQRTDAGRAAAHTSRAGGDRSTVELGLDRFRSGLPGRRGRCVERLRDDPRGAGRCIEQQYVHREISRFR